MATKRISALPSEAAPTASDVVPIDGASTRKTTIVALVNGARPFASESEAEAGIATTVGMNPLRTRQAIEALGMPASTYDPNGVEGDAFSRANHSGTQSADTVTDGTTNKAYTATEKTKLANIAAGATANDTDANLKNRANHTGTQAISTVTGLQTALDSKASTSVATQALNGLMSSGDKLKVDMAIGVLANLNAGASAATNAATLQAAINSLTDGNVLIPEGQFACNAVTLKPGVRLFGRGRDVTRLLAGSNSIAMLNYTASGSMKEKFLIHDIGLDANGKTGVTAISLDGGSSGVRISDVSLRALRIVGAFAQGVDLRFCANSQLEDIFATSVVDAFVIDSCADTDLFGCKAQLGSGTGFTVRGVAGPYDEGVRMVGCSTNGQNIGMLVNGQDYGLVSGCSFTTCPGGSLIAQGTTSNWKFSSCDFANAGSPGPSMANVDLSVSTSRFTFAGCNNLLGTFGFVLRGSGHSIVNTNCNNNTNVDVYLDGATGCTVVGNVIESAAVAWGILEAGAADYNVVGMNRVVGTVTLVGAHSISGSGTREILAVNRTYYVRADGSDANGGLSNTAGGAFLTIQKAIDVIASLDLRAFNVTIQVADGTYTGPVVVNGAWLGSGTVTLQGNAGTPANVLVSITGGTAISVINGGRLTVKDMKLQTTSGSTYCLYANAGGRINFSNINFGAAGNSHMRASDTGLVTCDGNYSISGNASFHWRSVASGIIRCPNKTVTLTGTPAFTVFASATDGGVMVLNGNTFSGSATGTRYDATLNGVIDTAGGGATYLPGNASGTTATGGQYA